MPGGAAYDFNQSVELSNWCAALAECTTPLPSPVLLLTHWPPRLFFCYMCYDLGHVVAAYPLLGGLDTLFHHGAFLVAAIVAGSQRAFSFAFGWLVLCEASTPFLNARWFYRCAPAKRLVSWDPGQRAGSSRGGCRAGGNPRPSGAMRPAQGSAHT